MPKARPPTVTAYNSPGTPLNTLSAAAGMGMAAGSRTFRARLRPLDRRCFHSQRPHDWAELPPRAKEGPSTVLTTSVSRPPPLRSLSTCRVLLFYESSHVVSNEARHPTTRHQPAGRSGLSWRCPWTRPHRVLQEILQQEPLSHSPDGDTEAQRLDEVAQGHKLLSRASTWLKGHRVTTGRTAGPFTGFANTGSPQGTECSRGSHPVSLPSVTGPDMAPSLGHQLES